MNFDREKARKKRSQSGSYAALAIGVGTAIYGGIQSSNINKENKKRASAATADEERRRAAAGEELARATESLNALRSERPGATFEEWKNEYIKGLTDPVLRENFRKVKQEDFEAATDFAKQASEANIRNFLAGRDVLSQGKAAQITANLNELAMTADSESAVKRAMELRAPFIPTGTVRYDSEGRLVENQRATKQVFNTSYETDLAARDRSFRMQRDLLLDYSNIADRQTEKSKDFLQFASIEPLVRSFAEKALETSIDYSKQDTQNQFDLIKMYAAAQAGVQPTIPQYQSTAASDQLTAAGIQAAIKGIASYAGSNNGGGSSRTSTPSYVNTTPYGQVF